MRIPSFTLLLALAATARADDPPNILLVLADDLGIGDLGAYNPDSRIPTPHMDRLAAEGTRFTDAHSPSGVCTPTRYGVLTGRYCWRSRLKSGVLNGTSRNLIELDRATLPEVLAGGGYHTACIGKWHLGLGTEEPADYAAPLAPSPVDHGFDTFWGIPASLDMQPYVYVLDRRAVQPPERQVEASAHRRQGGGGFWRGGGIALDFRHAEVLPRIRQRAVETLERWRREDAERPGFLYVPLTAPHTPWLPTEAYRGVTEIGHYGDFVAQVDGVVGALLDALDRLGIAEQTLVVVTSDNGSHWPDADVERWGHDANLGYRGQKADIWEGGHRVPFVVRWPGRVPAGTVRDDLVGLTDLFATFAGIAGVAVPEGAAEDSVDQSGAFLGAPGEPARESIVHHSASGTFAIRAGSWKLVEGNLGSGGFTAPRNRRPEPGGPAGQLYDLARDPAETTNLYLERPEVVERLLRRLDALR